MATPFLGFAHPPPKYKRKMEIINYSQEKSEKILSMLPNGLKAEKVIVLPDICKVRWRIPTGMVVLTKQEDWRKFAISDIGCGMLLCQSDIKATDFDTNVWDELYYKLKAAGKEIGDLSIGNHFIDALKSKTDGNLYFLIHCGVDKNIELLENLSINNYAEFGNYCKSIIQQAGESRYAIFEIIKSVFGNLKFILNKNHNHYENTENGVIIRAYMTKKDQQQEKKNSPLVAAIAKFVNRPTVAIDVKMFPMRECADTYSVRKTLQFQTRLKSLNTL